MFLVRSCPKTGFRPGGTGLPRRVLLELKKWEASTASPNDSAHGVGLARLSRFEVLSTRKSFKIKPRTQKVFTTSYWLPSSAAAVNRTSPESKIVVVDSSEQRLESLKAFAPESIRTFLLPAEITEELSVRHQQVEHRHELQETIEMIREAMHDHFGGRRCNLMFDASSGNTAPLWDNPDILGPTAHCIPFGFGSRYVLLSSRLLQQSRLSLFMTRGVGNIRNRKEVIELIKAGASGFIHDFLIGPSKRYNSMEEVMELIREMHDPPQPLHRVPPVYLCPHGVIA